MLTELAGSIHGHIVPNGAAAELFSSMWQVLATLAIGGIVLVLILAIIEPGPLVKKRPFARKRRSQQSDSEEAGRAEPGVTSVKEGQDSSAYQKEDDHNPT